MGLRVLMGLGNQLFFMGGCCILAALYPNDLTKAMGAFKTFFGVGMMSGFLLGTLLYTLFKYVPTFCIMAALNALPIPLFLCMIPSESAIDDIKKTVIEDDRESHLLTDEEKEERAIA